MSAYPVPPAQPGAPSPHTGFVPPGAAAAPGANASVYSTNSAPFSSPYGGPNRQTGYSHQQQQYNSGSSVPQQYQQLSSYHSADVHPSPAHQQKQQPAMASFQSAMHPSAATVQASLQGSSVLQQQQQQQNPAAEEEAMACTQEIAHAFVYQYYLMLHENPSDIYRFYDQDSKMHRMSDRAYSDGDSGCLPEDYCVRAVGLQRIMHAFQRIDFDRATCRIRNIDAQEVQNGGILVLVTGCLKHSKDKPEREFVQTVLLAKMRPPRTGWYVHTEMFIYLDATMTAAGKKAAAEARKESQAQQHQHQQHLEQQKQQHQQQQQLQQEQQHQQQQQAQQKAEQQHRTEEAPKAHKEARQSSPMPRKEAAPEKPAADAKVSQQTVETQKQQQQQADAAEQTKTAKTSERTVRSKWTKQEVPEEGDASPHWPKPGQVPEMPAEKEQQTRGSGPRVQHNYDPQSFAFKVLQNVRPVAQKGFAIPANPSASAEVEEGRGHGRCHEQQQQQQQQQGPNKRLIVLTELPPPVNVEEIKRFVAEALSAHNQGQAVDVRKPAGGRTFGVIIELDTLQSAQLLMEHGLTLNGRQVRIDFVRPRGAAGLGRGGRGGHSQRGGWEERRPSGEPRRGGRGGGHPGNHAVGSAGQERPNGEDGDEEGEGQWIDPAARRRPRPQRGGAFAGGPSRARGGFRGGPRAPQE